MKVLVVEDEAALSRQLAGAFRAAGYAVDRQARAKLGLDRVVNVRADGDLVGPADAEPRLLRAARALEADGVTSDIPMGYEREFTWPGK